MIKRCLPFLNNLNGILILNLLLYKKKLKKPEYILIILLIFKIDYISVH